VASHVRFQGVEAGAEFSAWIRNDNARSQRPLFATLGLSRGWQGVARGLRKLGDRTAARPSWIRVYLPARLANHIDDARTNGNLAACGPDSVRRLPWLCRRRFANDV
jgi:hypothetical protein